MSNYFAPAIYPASPAERWHEIMTEEFRKLVQRSKHERGWPPELRVTGDMVRMDRADAFLAKVRWKRENHFGRMIITPLTASET